MSTFHIYAPPVFYARRILYCLTCRKNRRVVQGIGFDLDIRRCLGCGGNPHAPRSRFKTYSFARKQEIHKARAKWKLATDLEMAVRLSVEAEEGMFGL